MRRAGLSAIAEFLVLNILLIFLEIGPSEIILRVITVSHGSATLLEGRRSKSMGNGNFGGVRTPYH